MKIYYYAATTNRLDIASYQSRIKRLLRQTGAEVMSNTDRTAALSRDDLDAIAATGAIALDTMDALVIEGTEPDTRVGYLLAYAIAKQKPTLYLHERRTERQDALSLLDAKAIPATLKVRAYLKRNLDESVQNFLRSFSSLSVTEPPTIKFTLRITKTIERFLEYRTRNTKLTKADFLREEIDAIMKKDHRFWQWLKKQKS